VKAAGVFLAIALRSRCKRPWRGSSLAATAALDLVLVVVVYVALTTGPVSGMLAGSAAGIIQDALSSGVIGIGAWRSRSSDLPWA